MFRTVNYSKCHRCKGANDRGSQRTCSSCHRIIQGEYRAKQSRKYDELLKEIQQLENELAVALARAVAAESILAARRISGEIAQQTSREMAA